MEIVPFKDVIIDNSEHGFNETYQRGPRGGGTSNAMNPLRQTVVIPCPVFKMY